MAALDGNNLCGPPPPDACSQITSDAVLAYAIRRTDVTYRARFAQYSARVREEGPGCIACFSFPDDDSSMAHELQWFESESQWAAARAEYAKLGDVFVR
eukprot:3008475-Prymnesium_polylepis.1